MVLRLMSNHPPGDSDGVLCFARQTPAGPLVLRVLPEECAKVLAGNYPWRVWAVTKVTGPGEEGLAGPEEEAMLAQDEEELAARLPDEDKAIHCGSLQHQGHYVSLIHSATPDPFANGRTDDQEVFTSVYVWNVYCREDREGEFLQQRFLPTAKERRRIGDQQVLEVLAEAGDRPEEPRPIRFFGLFPSQESAEAATPVIAAEGFTVTGTAEIPSREGPRWSLMFEIGSPADPVSIEKLSSHAQRLCETAGGEYDGWECTPVTAEE